MTKVVGIRFKPAGRIYTFGSEDFLIEEGQAVIVETVRGKELGFCVVGVREVDEETFTRPIKPVIRLAEEYDLERYRENLVKAKEAMIICGELIKKHKLPMKLVDSNYTFDNQKLLFYFTADGRIDFRELVKDLASIYRTRIELRQIGVRDEAKILGGIGPCGRELCCTDFLTDFHNVTIQMAKNQNIGLVPSKISGMCGRLLCCLQFEEEFYEEKLKTMPSIKDKVETEEGRGIVTQVYPITDEVAVNLVDNDMQRMTRFKLDEIKMCDHCELKDEPFMYESDRLLEELEGESLEEIIKDDSHDHVDIFEEDSNKPKSIGYKESKKDYEKNPPRENGGENSTYKGNKNRFNHKKNPNKEKKEEFKDKNKPNKNDRPKRENEPRRSKRHMDRKKALEKKNRIINSGDDSL